MFSRWRLICPFFADHLFSRCWFWNWIIQRDVTKSFYAQKDRLVKLINQAFKDNGVSGSAIVVEGITGTGKPCSQGFTILINSCESVSIQDGSDVDITPCIAEYNPYTGLSFTNEAECVGCNTGTTFTPTTGIRLVGKGLKVNASNYFKHDRKSWYHTDVRITMEEDSNIKQSNRSP